ncbi:Vacuolar protease A [Gryganskiella cystojenkinii]|nr:Vacuolar protease A [Gryganskiella cystojenkinii]
MVASQAVKIRLDLHTLNDEPIKDGSKINLFARHQQHQDESNDKQIPFRRPGSRFISTSNQREGGERHDIPLESSLYNLGSIVGMISLGTPRQEFKVQLSLGHSYFYVPSLHCQDSCVYLRKYNSKESSTYRRNGTVFSIPGQAQGVISQDSFFIDDLEIPNLQFGEALSITRYWFPYFYSVDGALGLGYGDDDDNGEDSSSTTGSEPWLVRLRRHRAIDEPVLGIYLGTRFQGGWGGGLVGQMTIGGLDEYRFQGRVHWEDTIRPGKWNIKLEKVLIDWDDKDKSSSWSTRTETIFPPSASLVTAAYLRPENMWISLPSEMARELNLALGFKESTVPGNENNYDCLSRWEEEEEDEGLVLPRVGIQLGRSSVAVYWFTSREYMLKSNNGGQKGCFSIFVGQASQGIDPERDQEGSGAVLGAVFMKKYFTALDFESHRIGFAPAK